MLYGYRWGWEGACTWIHGLWRSFLHLQPCEGPQGQVYTSFLSPGLLCNSTIFTVLIPLYWIQLETLQTRQPFQTGTNFFAAKLTGILLTQRRWRKEKGRGCLSTLRMHQILLLLLTGCQLLWYPPRCSEGQLCLQTAQQLLYYWDTRPMREKSAHISLSFGRGPYLKNGISISTLIPQPASKNHLASKPSFWWAKIDFKPKLPISGWWDDSLESLHCLYLLSRLNIHEYSDFRYRDKVSLNAIALDSTMRLIDHVLSRGINVKEVRWAVDIVPRSEAND